MTYRFSDAEQLAAVVAANGSVNGSKNAAYLSTWISRLGVNPSLNLYRDGTRVWQASTTGLTVSGSEVTIPVGAVQQSISDADIDTGTWEFRVEKNGDATVYFGADVAKAGAQDILALTNDLSSSGSVEIGAVKFVAPAFDVATPSGGLLLRSDPRVIAWMDANYAFKDQLHAYGLQIRENTNGQTVRNVNEPGVLGAGSDYTFSRESNPYGDGYRFRHRTSPLFPLWPEGGGINTQRSQWLSTLYLQEGVTYWMATDFTIESDWNSSYYTGADAWRNAFSIGDVHHNSWSAGPYGVAPGAQAPIGFYCDAGRSYGLSVYGNYTPGSGGKTGVSLFTAVGTVGQVVRIVMQFRLGRAWSDGPFIRVWRQIDDGAETLMADRSDVMIGYSDMRPNECYLKMGLYGWGPLAAQKTTYTKGTILARDVAGVPNLTAANMFALLRSL